MTPASCSWRLTWRRRVKTVVGCTVPHRGCVYPDDSAEPVADALSESDKADLILITP